MSYSNGTPAPGDAIEHGGRLYVVTGLDSRGRVVGTDLSRLYRGLPALGRATAGPRGGYLTAADGSLVSRPAESALLLGAR